MSKKAKEKWKSIKFSEFNTDKNYQVSNYGRVRMNINGAKQLKRMIHYADQILYKFSFPASLNDNKRKILHVKAAKLVAKHFCEDYYEGCYVQHKDFNRLNNYYKNILCLSLKEARSHAAKGRHRRKEEFFVQPPDQKVVTETHKVEVDDNFFKPVVGFPKYEINREGVIRRRKAPYVGRRIKPRLHPDKFYFCELRNEENKRKTIYIHKAVAEAWNINLTPDIKKVVVHLDGDTTNNHSDNLEWMTPSEAMKLQFKQQKRDNKKSWKTRKKLYGNGFKNKGKIKKKSS